MNRIGNATLGMLALVAGLAATPTAAGDKASRREMPHDAPLDQDDVLTRLRRSEFKPLSEVLAAGQKVIPGEVVRVRVKRVRDRLAYELKIITPQGLVREVYIDPMTLDNLKVE